ncbi:MAG TPA: hypothetical protein VLC53_19955, partial [Myxococcota bacterium]|nr:hypothetical protein [Myxococcota bacterium]
MRKRPPGRLEELVRAVDLELGAADLQRLDAASASAGGRGSRRTRRPRTGAKCASTRARSA